MISYQQCAPILGWYSTLCFIWQLSYALVQYLQIVNDNDGKKKRPFGAESDTPAVSIVRIAFYVTPESAERKVCPVAHVTRLKGSMDNLGGTAEA